MNRLFSRRLKRGTIIMGFCLSLLAGIGLARFRHSLSIYWAIPAFSQGLLSWRRHNYMTLLAAISLGLFLGLWRGSIYMQKLDQYPFDHRITVTVRATEDATYGSNKQLIFGAKNITLENGEELTGKMQVSGFGANAIFDGDEVEVTGKIRQGYSAYQARMSYAKLQVIKHNPSIVAEIRRRFATGMRTALPDDLASFSMGLLIGQRATLPDSVKQDLMMVGLTHIIAVSGYNLTIILHASRRVLGGFSKRLSTFLSISLILVFLIMAGSSASIVRAAIVSMLSIGTAYYGRNFRPLPLLSLAAAITVWASPYYLWSDLSWYLSFMAFYGVMVFAPLVQKRWPAHWHQTLVGGVALESLCAEVMSLPFVLHTFGQMSLIGLPANMLVVSLVPLAMLLGLISGLAGMFLPTISGLIAWPAELLLNYMLDVAHVMSQLPHVFITNRSLSIAGMLMIYMVIGMVTYILTIKTKALRPDIITDINEPKTRGFLT